MAEIEIGRGKSARQGYDLDDVSIVPSRRTRDADEVALGAGRLPDTHLTARLRDREHRHPDLLDLPEHRVLGRAVDHIGRVAALAATGLDGPLGGGGVGLHGVPGGSRRAAAEAEPIGAVWQGHAAAYPRRRCPLPSTA